MSAAGFGLIPRAHFTSPPPQAQLETPWKTSPLGWDCEAKGAHLGLLLAIMNRMVAAEELADLLRYATSGVRRVLQSDVAVIALLDTETRRLCVNALDSSDKTTVHEELQSVQAMFDSNIFSTTQLSKSRGGDLTRIEQQAASQWAAAGFRCSCVLPLVTHDQVLGVLALRRRAETGYSRDEVDFLMQVCSQVAIAVDSSRARSELQRLKDRAGEERIYLEDEISSELNFEEIVGRSPELRRVLRQAEVVAPTDSGVLVQGETGTGKELIARAIHNLSARRGRPFVKLNCAAIPSGLLESELFGHEKGAFTGAIMRKAGRFEIADKGTLFLDEVGDIPLEVQPKLLRVLQEREFERLGSTRTQHVDVRVIAATHRDLKQMVENGQFRSDLYYRLHVFPLSVPPLRERREDIPLLIRHYVDKYARRMNRQIESIPAQSVEVITSYTWPGNVRELQNFIERAVILSPGPVLCPPLTELIEAGAAECPSKLSTLEEAEREHVARALRESNWVIGGPNGAAARLGLKRTTLAYRIRKLNIPVRPE